MQLNQAATNTEPEPRQTLPIVSGHELSREMSAEPTPRRVSFRRVSLRNPENWRMKYNLNCFPVHQTTLLSYSPESRCPRKKSKFDHILSLLHKLGKDVDPKLKTN